MFTYQLPVVVLSKMLALEVIQMVCIVFCPTNFNVKGGGGRYILSQWNVVDGRKKVSSPLWRPITFLKFYFVLLHFQCYSFLLLSLSNSEFMLTADQNLPALLYRFCSVDQCQGATSFILDFCFDLAKTSGYFLQFWKTA